MNAIIFSKYFWSFFKTIHERFNRISPVTAVFEHLSFWIEFGSRKIKAGIIQHKKKLFSLFWEINFFEGKGRGKNSGFLSRCIMNTFFNNRRLHLWNLSSAYLSASFLKCKRKTMLFIYFVTVFFFYISLSAISQTAFEELWRAVTPETFSPLLAALCDTCNAV